MKKLSLLLLLLAVIGCLSAAITDYALTEGVGTYQPLTTYTASTASGDDGTQLITLPFAFTYNGVAYTTLGVCMNGFAMFGATNGAWTNQLESTSVRPVVAPLWDDMYYNTTTQIRYATLGSGTSRTFVVEWYNSLWHYSGGTAQQFQLRLSETSNEIMFSYNLQTPGSTPTASIGINDQTGGSSHYLSVTPGAPSTVSSTTPNNSINGITNLPAGKWYKFTYVPPAVGILSVNPNPVAFGNVYIGIPKTIPVSLYNVGGANFTVNSVTLTTNTVFTIPTPPASTVLTPGGAPLVFNMVYTPTGTTGDTDVLTINDTRASTNVNVSGTGFILQVGEICENPYVVSSLPLVDYTGTTSGFNNDYTSAMFTGVTNSSYLNGRDWVAKVTIPEAGALTVSVADQAGFTYQYTGVYVVNSIPSLATPVPVLGQAIAANGTVTISGLMVNPGVHYIIIDNWPSPDVVNFVLNVSFATITTPPSPAVLVAPTPSGVTGISLTPTLSWSNGGGVVEKYFVSYGTQSPYTTIVNNFDNGTATSYGPLPTLAYGTEYWWQITPWNSSGYAAGVTPWTFTTLPDPTQPLPYTQNFDGGTTLAGINWSGNMAIYTSGGNPTNRLSYNLYSSAPSCNAVSCPVGPLPADTQLLVDYRLMNWSSYPNGGAAVIGASDNIQIQVSDNGGATWGPAIYTVNSSNHTTSTSYVTLTIPVVGYAGMNVMFKILGTWGVGDYYVDIDNFVVRQTPVGAPLPPALAYPVALPGLPKNGFNLSWTPDPMSGPTNYYNVYFWTDEQSIGDGPIWSTTGTSLNPTAPPLDPLGNTQDPIVFDYLDRYNWTVEAYSDAYPTQEAWPAASWFEIESNPAITTFPYLQTFGVATFPPTLWTLETAGTYAWTRNAAVNGYGAVDNMGAARANFYSQSSATPYDLITAPINLGGMAGTLTFDHAYATYSGENDQLEILASTDGTNYTSLHLYDGGAAGPLNTGGTQTATFVPTAAQWATKTLNLPLGTTYVKFRAISAYGNDLYIDNIGIDQRVGDPHDIALTGLSGLPAIQQTGDTYNPIATVANYGTSTETFDVTLSIPTGYSSTQTVTNLLPGATTTVNFASWNPAVTGPYAYTVDAPLTGDANPLDNTMTGSFNVFDTIWTDEASCPVGSYLGSAASYIDGSGNGHIITSGGNTTNYNEVYDYNVNTDTWSFLATIPGQRRVHASAIHGTDLYIIGGSDASSVYQSTMFKFDILANTWTTMSPLPIALGWGKALTYQDYIIVAGGVDGVGALTNAVYLYNTLTDTWLTGTSMPTPIFGGAFARTGNTLVYVAGADLTVISNAIYVGQINPSDPTIITWGAARSTYPGLPSSVSMNNIDLRALEAGIKDIKNPITRTYPAGAMYRFDGGTWGHEAILVAGGSPSAAWVPADPCPSYTYYPATDTWVMNPNLTVAVTGAYMNTVQSSATTWNAIVASGYTGSATVANTQKLTAEIEGPLPTPVVTISQVGGTIYLNWPIVPGALGGYRIEKADTPYGPWTDTQVVGTNSWSGPAVAKKFYQVIALP